MAAPTFIQEAETAWGANAAASRTTASFSVQAGDVLVAMMLSKDTSQTGLLTATGGSLTWTAQQTVNVTSYGVCVVATAVVDTNKSMTATVTRAVTTGSQAFGINVLTFRAAAVGASAKANAISSASTVNLTTTAANSAIVVADTDQGAADGAGRAWRANAGALTEVTYSNVFSLYTFYGGYHADAGAAGTYAVGLSTPFNQNYSIVALEVKGAVSATATPQQQQFASNVARLRASHY